MSFPSVTLTSNGSDVQDAAAAMRRALDRDDPERALGEARELERALERLIAELESVAAG